MPLSEAGAVDAAKELLEYRTGERDRLEKLRGYLRDDPDKRLTGIPASAPIEVHQLARISRVNLMKFVVNSRVQAMFIDGYRVPRSADDAPAWDVWLRNRMNLRQTGVNRAAVSFGAAYMSVLPGEPVPVMRGASPRNMTAVYGDDDEWPFRALERRRSGWRLYDDQAWYALDGDADGDGLKLMHTEVHGARIDGRAVCPVVRFRDTDDLDDPVCGVVEPLTNLQDQINVTSFGLQVAQHYSSFKQRAIVGWLAESEAEALKMGASKFMVFEDHPDDIKFHEFAETNLSGYIDSREASLRHLATVSQTPVHELTAQLVNLSAEALAAAEASHRRAVGENQTALGEGYDQALTLAGAYMGLEPDPSAAVRWRDTESRSLAQVADALGKIASQLGVPPQALWEKIPGVTDQELEQWKALAAEGDSLGNLTAMLERQAQPEPEPVPGGVA